MRGGLDERSILRQCIAVNTSNKKKINEIVTANNITLRSTSDFANPCNVIVTELIAKNVINDGNANKFFSSL